MKSLHDKKWMHHAERLAKMVDEKRPTYHALTDTELRSQTDILKKRYVAGESLDSLLVDAFSTVRETALRVTGMEPYHVQVTGGIALHEGKIAEIQTGEGKSVPVDTPIATPSGWRLCGNICVGDQLFDRHGKPTTVTGVYPQGVIDTYEIMLKDGRTIRCGEDHLWAVYTGYKTKVHQVLKTKDMYKVGAKLDKGKGFRYHLPTSECVQYETADQAIDPYVMGYMLGNGCRNDRGCFQISSNDEEAIAYIAEKIHATHFEKSKRTYTWTFYKKYSGPGAKDNIRMKIEDIAPQYVELLSGLYSYEKYIPKEYKQASESQRWALIQGMMDSDGNIYEDQCKRFNIRYATSSARLRDDFMEVLRSLGCLCSCREGRTAGAGKVKRDQFDISPMVPHSMKPHFFRLKRKKAVAEKASYEQPKNRDYSRIAITDIRKLAVQTEQICFTVDNYEHLFLVGDFIVTHNTLVATMPSYLNALTGDGVHVVTVNDYLAARDAASMGKIHQFLGLSVGVITDESSLFQRKNAYNCDITYITNTQVGFDYLRDNLAKNMSQVVQRELNYAIIDEVDSILIDEARTPLILSGNGSDVSKIYLACDQCAKQMVLGEESHEFNSIDAMLGDVPEESGDFIIHEKEKDILITAEGIKKVERWFGIDNYSDPKNIAIQHVMDLALRANYIMRRNKDYIVEDDEIRIVDEFTGRIMDGREYCDGLHQAIQAKEGVSIKQANETIASTTYQNFFVKYRKTAGMTGTAASERREFRSTYHLDTVVVPTNKPVIRKDYEDKFFLTEKGKLQAVIEDIKATHEKGQPILVGTASVETSEKVSALLRHEGITHQVLNAKQNAKEAEIISHAGEFGSVTVATNMAGRGTDIVLDEKSVQAGGLKVIGTERHESQRIDNQLRGRSGRQGDPGETIFYLSAEDHLMLYSAERAKQVLLNGGYDPEKQITDRLIVSAVKKAQKNIEDNNFGIRKSVLDYDRITDKQRALIYSARRKLIEGADASREMQECLTRTVDSIISFANDRKGLDVQKVADAYCVITGKRLDTEMIKGKSKKQLASYIKDDIQLLYDQRYAEQDEAYRKNKERISLLTAIDSAWMEQLKALDFLKQDVFYVSYAQLDPKSAYAIEAFKLYDTMKDNIYMNAVRLYLSADLAPRPMTSNFNKEGA